MKRRNWIIGAATVVATLSLVVAIIFTGQDETVNLPYEPQEVIHMSTPSATQTSPPTDTTPMPTEDYVIFVSQTALWPSPPPLPAETVAAYEFLRQFITLWQLSDYSSRYDRETGRFFAEPVQWWDDELQRTDGRLPPTAFISVEWEPPGVIVFDRNGNDVYGAFVRAFEHTWFWDDVVYIRVQEAYASNFLLYNLDENGKPVIVIMFLAAGASDMFSVVYQFIDGKYQEVFEGGHLSFFHDNQGNLILRDNGPSHHMMEGTYHHVVMTDEGMTFLSATYLMENFPVFPEHDEDPFDDDLLLAIRALRMDELEKSIFTNIRAYFANLPPSTLTIWTSPEPAT